MTIRFNDSNEYVIGIDEVGRGCLAGPVVTCAFTTNYINIPNGIKDSKKLSKKNRELLYNELTSSNNHQFAIGISGVDEIDDINILNATMLAMTRSFQALTSKYPQLNKNSISNIIIDGNKKPDLDHFNHISKAIIKGDNTYLEIACASIIAKVYRDNLMRDLAVQYSEYQLQNNYGYGTKEHINAIQQYGISNIHRKTFISKLNQNNLPF